MFEPVIKSLIIQRFRSVPVARLELGNPTFLVGPNGSGKSNLVDAFAFLADAMVLPLQALFDSRGGLSVVHNRPPAGDCPANLGLGVFLGPLGGDALGGHYAFEVRMVPGHGFEVVREQCRVEYRGGKRCWFDRRNGEFRSNVSGLDPALEPMALGMPVIGGDARFAPLVRLLASVRVHLIKPDGLRRTQDPNGGSRLRRDGTNSATVLREIARLAPEDMDRICEILATIVPSTRRVTVKDHGNKLSLEFTQEWGGGKRCELDAACMSDGTLRALGLLSAVYQQPRPSLLVIEEPEASIHAGAVAAVVDLIRHATRSMQVVVTTHSPEVLDADWIEDKHLRIAEWEGGATGIARLSQATSQALRQRIMGAGELLRSNALEAEPMIREDLGHPGLFEDDDA